MHTITEQQIREFIAKKAAELALETKGDQVFLSCYCLHLRSDYGLPSSSKWSFSVGTLPSVNGDTLDEAIAAFRNANAPASKMKRAQELRDEADKLMREAAEVA